jgi:hypothetical protein
MNVKTLALPMAVVSLLTLGCIGEHGLAQHEAGFVLTATCVDALEDGPCILCVTLKYFGLRPIPKAAADYPCEEDPTVDAPPTWAKGPIRGTVTSGYWCYQTIKPGDEWTRYLYLPSVYVRIPPGTARLKIRWRVYQANVGQEDAAPGSHSGHLIAWPSATLDITVPAATRANVAAALARFRQRLSDEKATVFAPEAEQALRGIRHPLFGEFVRQTLEEHLSADPGINLLAVLHDCSPTPAQAEANLLALATNPRCRCKQRLFAYLREHPAMVSGEGLRRLLRCEDLWTRVFTLAVFADRCPREWQEGVLHTLEGLCKAVPPPDFLQAIHELDADAFAIRERATARLRSLGAFAEAPLRQALAASLPAESRRRVRVLLDEMEAERLPEGWTPACDLLESIATPQAGAILRTLANGRADSLLTQAARTCLKSRPESGSPASQPR